MEKLKELIAVCVLGNVTFEGNIGTVNTVQDLLAMVGVRQLDKMYKAHNKQLKDLDTDSLFETKNTIKEKELQLKVDTLRAVFAYKQELATKEREKAEKAEKLTLLKKFKTEAEFNVLANASPEELDKQIAELEAATA